MNFVDLTAELLDSKRFCELFRQAGMGFTKRALTDADKKKLIEPVIEIIMDKIGRDVPSAPQPSVHIPRTDPAVLARKPTLRPGIELGNLGDDHGLPFDPFKDPQAQADAALAAALPPDVNPRDRQERSRAEALAMLKDALGRSNPHNIGDKVRMVLPPQWNAAEAPLIFERLGGYVLAPGPDGSFGVKTLGNDGWEVVCMRVK